MYSPQSTNLRTHFNTKRSSKIKITQIYLSCQKLKHFINIFIKRQSPFRLSVKLLGRLLTPPLHNHGWHLRETSTTLWQLFLMINSLLLSLHRQHQLTHPLSPPPTWVQGYVSGNFIYHPSHSSPSSKTYSSLDPLQLVLSKQVSNTIAILLFPIICNSLITGCVPTDFKKAVTTPLLKKSNFDSLSLVNYRPISYLCYPHTQKS